MYEQIAVQTETLMPDLHTDEVPDVPGDILPYKCTDEHKATFIWIDAWMHRCTERQMSKITIDMSVQQGKMHAPMSTPNASDLLYLTLATYSLKDLGKKYWRTSRSQ